MSLTDAQLKNQAQTLRSIADLMDPPGISTPSAGGPVGATGSWKQMFGDEFTGSALDLTKWRKGDYEKADGYFRDFNSKSTALYIPEQVSFRDGKLVLQAVKRKTIVVIVPDSDKRKNTFIRGADVDTFFSTWDLQRTFLHQSGAITTAGDRWGMTNGFTQQNVPPTFAFQYGWFEASVKMPKGRGLWPAFWTKEVKETDAQEMDVFELVDPSARKVAMHLHGGAKPGWDWTMVEGPGWDSGVDLSADFHTYAINWQKDRVEWYFDGKLIQACTEASRIPTGHHYLLLNLAVSGDWPGYPDASTVFPAEMLVDWVRVWSLT